MSFDFRDTLYDWSVVGSYTRIGYRHRAGKFNPVDVRPNMADRVFVVTGANSGIGLAATRQLAAMGARVVMACRSFDRAIRAMESILKEMPEAKLQLMPVDVSELGSVHGFCDWLSENYESIDGLIHNAGVLIHEHRQTSDGHEVTLATHLLGPWLMTNRLLPLLNKSDSGRVVYVTSGGMYTQKLNLKYLLKGPNRFDGVRLYAQAKRAQVIICEELSQQLKDTNITINSMHPGWTDTPGVESALPGFYKLMEPILRSPDEGADTATWLASSHEVRTESGKLFLDRRPRRTHVFPWTRESRDDRRELLSRLEALTSSRPDAEDRRVLARAQTA